jgi:hypothetical protein
MTLTKEKTSELTKLPNLTIFGKINKEMINHFTPPYSVRNDCQIGQWKVGEDNLLGNSLKLSIIAMKNYYGNLGKTKHTQWLQLWFVAAPSEQKLPSNTVCVTYLKTRSLTQLGQKAIEVMQNEDPGMGIFTASYEKHAGDYGNYYSIKWEWRDRTNEELPQLHLIADFLATNPNFNDANLPNTMIQLPDGDGIDPIDLVEVQKIVKEIEASKKDKK